MSLLPRRTPPDSSDLRWRSVVTRNASDNTFVYAVSSTRIYCRPCCPARLARRANIEFFDLPEQAEIAGYRPCKRCKPSVGDAGNRERQIVRETCNTIAKLLSTGQRPDLHQLASDANLSYSHFHRTFKKITGVAPGQYVKSIDQAPIDPLREEALPTPIDTWNLEEVDLFQPYGGAGQPGEYSGPSGDSIDWNIFDIMIAQGIENS